MPVFKKNILKKHPSLADIKKVTTFAPANPENNAIKEFPGCIAKIFFRKSFEIRKTRRIFAVLFCSKSLTERNDRSKTSLRL
jgi:hypothetical protein